MLGLHKLKIMKDEQIEHNHVSLGPKYLEQSLGLLLWCNCLSILVVSLTSDVCNPTLNIKFKIIKSNYLEDRKKK